MPVLPLTIREAENQLLRNLNEIARGRKSDGAIGRKDKNGRGLHATVKPFFVLKDYTAKYYFSVPSGTKGR